MALMCSHAVEAYEMYKCFTNSQFTPLFFIDSMETEPELNIKQLRAFLLF